MLDPARRVRNSAGAGGPIQEHCSDDRSKDRQVDPFGGYSTVHLAAGKYGCFACSIGHSPSFPTLRSEYVRL